MRSQGVALGWYALPRWGKWNDNLSDTVGPHHVSDTNPQPRVQSHALTGHRIPAQGANPGNPPGKTTPRSEGTPHSLRVSDLDPGLSYAVFLQNTPILWDVVPRADALGWYALPRWGKWNDDVSDTGHQRHFRYRTPTTCPVPFLHRVSDTGPPPRFRFHALTAVPIPGLSTVFRIPCPDGASHTSPGCKPHSSSFHFPPSSPLSPPLSSLIFHISYFSFLLSAFCFLLLPSRETPACRSVIFR